MNCVSWLIFNQVLQFVVDFFLLSVGCLLFSRGSCFGLTSIHDVLKLVVLGLRCTSFLMPGILLWFRCLLFAKIRSPLVVPKKVYDDA
jgi:hypothetical protein